MTKLTLNKSGCMPQKTCIRFFLLCHYNAPRLLWRQHSDETDELYKAIKTKHKIHYHQTISRSKLCVLWAKTSNKIKWWGQSSIYFAELSYLCGWNLKKLLWQAKAQHQDCLVKNIQAEITQKPSAGGKTNSTVHSLLRLLPICIQKGWCQFTSRLISKTKLFIHR